MKRFARVENGIVREVIVAKELPEFHEDIRKQFSEAPANVKEGWTFDGEAFTPPNPADEKGWEEKRRDAILSEWPLHKQLEAFVEREMGRPEKLEQLKEHMLYVRNNFPKLGEK
jgi:hypothetical protein